jgi:hypothetical protein
MYEKKWMASICWMDVGNREVYNGLSVLDYDGGTYVQARRYYRRRIQQIKC